MKIRRAKEQDIGRLIELLQQVLELHAAIRPDIFVSGTTKYTEDELAVKIKDDTQPIYVAVDNAGTVVGYAFCQLKEPPFAGNMKPLRSFYIDDLCVDEKARGHYVGEQLFEYVKAEAGRLGCYEVTLNVWEGNDGAKRFYEKMGMRIKEQQMEYII